MAALGGDTTPLDPDPAMTEPTAGQHRIAAAVFNHLGLTIASGMAMVEEQRVRLRRGGLRRSDDIETLTVLVRLLVGRPLADMAAIADIHRAYQRLRRSHWWPTGPEDLPLAALLVVATPDPDAAVARIQGLHHALSEGDEVPGDPCALVALCLSVPDDAQVVERMGALRTALLLSGIAIQEADAAALPALAAIAGDAQEVMREYLHERHAARPLVLRPEASTMAADAVVLRHLAGSARQGAVAALVIAAWMGHRRPAMCPPPRLAAV